MSKVFIDYLIMFTFAFRPTLPVKSLSQTSVLSQRSVHCLIMAMLDLAGASCVVVRYHSIMSTSTPCLNHALNSCVEMLSRALVPFQKLRLTRNSNNEILWNMVRISTNGYLYTRQSCKVVMGRVL